MATTGLHPIFPYAMGAAPIQGIQHNVSSQQQQLQQQQQQQKEQAKARRMERNREQARRSRVRKKIEMSRLQNEAEELRKENEKLKQLIKDNITVTDAQKILNECDSLHQSDFQLLENLAATKQSYVMTDPRLPDNPIIYVSDRFCKLTGFSREQAVGRNCRFLQGPGTDPKAVEVVRNAVSNGTDCTTVFLNYKADGTPFWNRCFIAALRDWDGNIVNYVGVQCEQDGPEDTNPQAKTTSVKKNDLSLSPQLQSIPMQPIASRQLEPVVSSSMEEVKKRRKRAIDDESDSIEQVDWSILAEALEIDFSEDLVIEDFSEDLVVEDSAASWTIPGEMTARPSTPPGEMAVTQSFEPVHHDESYLGRFLANPLEFTTRTVRSELIDSMLTSHGDVNDPRFESALSVLSAIYLSSGKNASYTNLHNGDWRSISRPHYSECLGRNEQGDFMYTLGKMSFDMFKPGCLRCSVQRTLNHIQPVCSMDGAPSAAPWSLRRELAAWNQTDDSGEPSIVQQQLQPATMLKSYELSTFLCLPDIFSIAVALTIEPCLIPSSQISSHRLQALIVTQGYMLPDPDTPNRLTVWFTGGKLSPVLPEEGSPEQSEYGGFDEWKAVFGGKHKRTWGESFRVMGAKLLLGAELPDGMEEDGTMKYTLHRPAGGHSRAYVDVLYLDDDLLILKSCRGIVHVMVRNNVVDSEAAETTTAPISSADGSHLGLSGVNGISGELSTPDIFLAETSNGKKRKWEY